jgi:hypothetical protein
MPRRTPGTRQDERWIARRVEWELIRRRWSYQRLADALEDVGCPINQSAIHHMIKGDPPRQIRANELAALAQVFEQPVTRLLMPLDLALSEEANELFEVLNRQRLSYLAAAQTTYETIFKITALLGDANTLDRHRLTRYIAEAETGMVNLLDLMLEAEAALRGEDFAEWPDSSEMYGAERD